jgi:predicted PurR-regulated permease PerM
MAANAALKPAARAKPDEHEAKLPTDSASKLVGRVVLTGLLFGLTLWVAWDFLPALGWAVVLALTTWPLYARTAPLFTKRSPGSILPLVFTILIAGILLVPIMLVLRQASQDSQTILQGIGQLRDQGVPVPGWVAHVPLAGEHAVGWWRSNLTDPKGMEKWFAGLNADSASTWIAALGGQLLHRTAMFFFTLVALFFLYRDGPWIAARMLETADKVLGDPGERLAGKMADAVRGTVGGTVVVAVAEGVLIGIGYFIAGVPNPFLFIVLTIAFAMLPFGAWAAFTAASLLLVAQGGSPLIAACVFGWGAFVMLVGDHFVWPNLVGGAARLPFLAALIGIFGGLQAFGLLGLFLGPVIMAAFLTIWREWLMQRRA